MKIDTTVLNKLLTLARLSMPDSSKKEVIKDLNEALGLIEAINDVDTEKTNPMAHPLDLTQPLRDDVRKEDIDREAMQEMAPSAKDGFYLVPRVIEKPDSE